MSSTYFNHCRCIDPELRRLARGRLLDRLLARFGWYPWECPLCRSRVFRRER